MANTPLGCIIFRICLIAGPTIIGILLAVKNYQISYNILNNITNLDTLLSQNQSPIHSSTLYALNNTGNIHIANIVKKEIRNVSRYDNLDVCHVDIPEHKYKLIRVDKKIQSVVSIDWITTANLSNLNILLPASLLEHKLECNTTELQKFALEKHFMINKQVFQKPNDDFIIAYGEIPKEKYPVIYYYIKNLDQNLAPNITYISNEPNEIITREYPVIGMIMSGIFANVLLLCLWGFVGD